MSGVGTLQLHCPFTYSVLAVFQLRTLVLAPSDSSKMLGIVRSIEHRREKWMEMGPFGPHTFSEGIRCSRADNLRVAKNLSQRGRKADFVDASLNSDTGTPENEWNGWG